MMYEKPLEGLFFLAAFISKTESTHSVSAGPRYFACPGNKERRALPAAKFTGKSRIVTTAFSYSHLCKECTKVVTEHNPEENQCKLFWQLEYTPFTKNTLHGLFVRKLVHHKTSWGSRLRLTTISLPRSVAAWYWMPSWNRQTKSWHEDYDIQFIQNKALGALNTLSNPVGKLHLSSLRQSPCQIWWWRLNSFRGIACERQIHTQTHTDSARLSSLKFALQTKMEPSSEREREREGMCVCVCVCV